MKHINRLLIIGLALSMSSAVFASRLQQDNDDYGNLGPACPSPGVGIENSCILNTASSNLVAQTFGFSDSQDFQVFDFQVTSGSNYTLTLTGTNLIPSDATISGFQSGLDAFGMFICGMDDIDGSLCTPSTADTSGVTFSPSTGSNGTIDSVTFTVVGGTAGFTFYVMQELTTDPTVTATYTPNGAAVPEPATVPLLLLGGLATVLFGRRRLARLQ